MKKILKYVFILISLFLVSCTDVIDVELQTGPPRLVIEASLNWEKGTVGNNQMIKLSISTPYFDSTDSEEVIRASVKIINENDGTEFVFSDQNNGLYTTSSFIPELHQIYILEINYLGETFIAKESLIPVTNISNITQSKENGFIDDVIGVSVSFIDPADKDNYYLVKFQEQDDLFPTLYDVDDEFTNGNEMTITYEKITDEETGEKELEPGDVLDIELYGISKNYYNYIRLLISQNESSGSPFSSIPAPLKGNCVNLLNPENYAYGYFRLTQVDRTRYSIQ